MVKFMINFDEKAIQASLVADWPEAIKCNLIVLKEDKNNIESLNRLSFAFIQNGNKTLAQRTISRVLMLDKYNPIANKNLALIKNLPKKLNKNVGGTVNTNFVEEPRSAKIVNLVDACSKTTFLKIRPGNVLDYKFRRRRICLFFKNCFVGKLPDDISLRLNKLMRKGVCFEILFQSLKNNKVQVFIKEG